jgi:ABC-2 type transport system permease protein
MTQIFAKELNSFFNSLVAYIVMVVFLTGMGLLMWVFPETSVLDYGYADLETLFSLGPYVFMFLIPAITMRSLAEEKKTGTIELLLTRPLTDWQIILGKYLACFAIVLFCLIPTLLYYFTVYKLGNPVGNVDTAGVIGSYIGLALLGGVFVSIGIFASSITSNQIVSFILAVFLCFIFFSGFQSIASVNVWGSTAPLIEQLGILSHYQSMSRGLLDSRDLLYFMSVVGLMLLITRTVLGSRQW